MPDLSNKLLNRAVSKAIHQYNMINDGDRIAVAVSGGKDSLTLLWILKERLSWIPVKYELFPIHIDPGFDGGFAESLRLFLNRNGYCRIHIENTDYGVLGHSDKNRENPCFLCARLRRKRLFEITEELGCNKIAFGHTKDDIIETLFINILYAGEISTMRPAQSFFQGSFHLIRPLAFADEDVIRQYVKSRNFPEFINPCPSSKISKRQEVRTLLKQLYTTNNKIKGNIFRALSHVKPEYLLKKRLPQHERYTKSA